MEEKDNILYVGNKPGTNNVDCYHKKDLTQNVFIDSSFTVTLNSHASCKNLNLHEAAAINTQDSNRVNFLSKELRE